ncbi:MAG TPA: NAD(P)-dependent oxidoreductase [Candidatus Binatia bacterium]
MSQLDRVGFIGLGSMGGSIALRLLRASFPVTVFDIDGGQMKRHLAEGAVAATSPAEVARRSTVVLASLQASVVEEVALGKDGLAAAGTRDFVFVDLSSTPPELAVKVSTELRNRGIEMLDSPVSGADIGAINGNLTLFVGGSYEGYQRALPVLQHVGRTVTYLGKNGNGQLGKLVNQMMQALCELGIYEGLLLAEKAGLDPKMFARAVTGGCAQSWRLDELVEQMLIQGEKKFRMRLQPGRTGRAIKLAKTLGVTLQGVEAADRVFSAQGWEVVLGGEED